MQTLSSPQGVFQLGRYPYHAKDTLRAWDAADEYLLQKLDEEQLPIDDTRLLIVNDGFGALSVALNKYQPTMQSDSYLAHAGAKANYQLNKLDENRLTLLSSLQLPEQAVDLLIMKVPKSLAMLEDQLHRLSAVVNAETKVIAAGMAKHIHSSTLQLFEKIIGPTHTSLARKKARLIFSQFDNTLTPGENPYPKSYPLEGTNYQVLNHAGVFSREKLDIGTRFFLQHLPANENAKTIVDLGCGNGIVGLMAAKKNPQAKVVFTDESWMAIESARENFHAAFDDIREAEFHWTDCLNSIKADSADLVLNNPPFHQQHTVGDFVARQMFRQSKKVLKQGGELWVIGNRHLGYHIQLKKLFGNVRTVASNNKFVILQSRKN